MEVGKRKEEASLPPDYVSLAQLQERWLQKQEEIKRKQKQEEEEKIERELKQKQEEDEKRERDARAQNERNRNRNRNQRATGVIEEKGKGDEIVLGGPGDGGENIKKIQKTGGRGRKKMNNRGAAAVEEKGKVGAEAEGLSDGGVGILSGEGGSGGGSSGVEEVGCVCVVEVLPRNGEIAHVNTTDLRGGFKKNGRYKGSPRVNGLKQSELAIDLEKEESEKGGGNKWRVSGRGRGSERGGERGVDRGKGTQEEGERGGDRGRGSERGGEGGRGSERGGEGSRGSERGGDRERGTEIGGDRRRGSERGRDRRRGSERGRDRGRGGERGKNGGNPERKINMVKECRPVVLEGNEVDLKLEEKADQDGISEVCSEIASFKVGDRNEMWGGDNRAKEDGAEGEGSNSDKVTVEIEKKVDDRVLARKGENGGSWTGYRAIGIRGSDNKAKEDGVEGEGSNGEIVAVELENKVDRKVLPRKGENRGWRGYRENGIWERDNKAVKDGVEGEGSNGDKVAVEIEKKVYYKVLARNGQNRGYGRGYWGNERWKGGFERGKRYTMPEISGDCKMQWVKKENKLDA